MNILSPANERTKFIATRNTRSGKVDVHVLCRPSDETYSIRVDLDEECFDSYLNCHGRGTQATATHQLRQTIEFLESATPEELQPYLDRWPQLGKRD